MLTLILLVAAYIPFIIFTMNWKLPWKFNTRHCTSGWRREKCEAGVGWNQRGPSRAVCGEATCSEPSREFCVQERLVESVSRASFQEVQLHCTA